MKKQIIALVLLVIVLLPMFVGVAQIKRLPRALRDTERGDGADDADGDGTDDENDAADGRAHDAQEQNR